MSKPAILITGVSGFIGKNLARHFSLKGWQVVGIDCLPFENSPTAYLREYHQMQLPSPDLGRLIGKIPFEGVIHCAGRASVPQSLKEPAADYTQGPVLTFSLLNALRESASKARFIFLSSAAVYGNPDSLPVGEEAPAQPISPYGYHKWQAELVVREFCEIFGVPCAVARVFSAYGPGLKRQVIWDMYHKIKFGVPARFFGTGEESRDFVHVLDVAQAVELILTRGKMEGDVYNVAGGVETRIGDLADQIHHSLGRPGEIAFDGQAPSGMPLRWLADIQKLAALGFQPSITLKEGLEFYTHWFLAEHSTK